MIPSNIMLLRDSSIHLLGALFMTISLSGLIMIPPASAHTHTHLKGRTLPIPDNPLTPPNQDPVNSLSRSQIASGLELPKNLIVPTCGAGGVGSSTTGGISSGGGSGCPPIVGTDGPDIIIATATSSPIIYGL